MDISPNTSVPSSPIPRQGWLMIFFRRKICPLCMPAVLTIYFLSTLFGTYTGIPPVITLRKISSLGSSSGIYVRSFPKTWKKKLICQFLCNKCIQNTPALVRVIRLYAIQLLIKRYPPSHMQHSPDPARPSTEGFHLEDSLPELEAKSRLYASTSWNQCLPFPLLIITYLQLFCRKDY